MKLETDMLYWRNGILTYYEKQNNINTKSYPSRKRFVATIEETILLAIKNRIKLTIEISVKGWGITKNLYIDFRKNHNLDKLELYNKNLENFNENR